MFPLPKKVRREYRAGGGGGEGLGEGGEGLGGGGLLTPDPPWDRIVEMQRARHRHAMCLVYAMMEYFKLLRRLMRPGLRM